MQRRVSLLILFFLLPLIILGSFAFRARPQTETLKTTPTIRWERTPLFIYFLDCAIGSSTIIDRGAHEVIIDGCRGDELVTFLEHYPQIINGPVELVVITQPSRDAFEGFWKRSFSAYEIEEIWDPGFDPPPKISPRGAVVDIYKNYTDHISRVFPKSVLKRPLEQFHSPAVLSGKIEQFQLPSMPGVTFTLLSSDSNPQFPDETATVGLDRRSFLSNNASIVLMIEVSGLRLLFPGGIWGRLPDWDAAKAQPRFVEGKLLELEARLPGTLRADLVVAPNGGSETSSTQRFIDAVAPQIAIFPANPLLSKPRPSVVARYERVAHVFSTGVHFEPFLDNIICTNLYNAVYVRPVPNLRCMYGGTPQAPGDGSKLLHQLDSWQGSDGAKTRAFTRRDVTSYLNRRTERQRDDDAGPDMGPETFHQADLSGIDLSRENFNGRSLAKANLSWADLHGSNLTGASLEGATTDHMYLDSTTVVSGANLASTRLFAKNMPKDFRGTVLTNATLQGVDLTGANFVGANLEGAKLKDSDLTGAVFEPLPGSIPSYTEMAVARNGYLKTLKFKDSPHALVELREAFKKAGLRDQERELTYAIERERNSRKRGIDYWFPRILFDLTSQYGMSPNRPLKIIGIFIFLFAIPYIVALFTRTKGGIWIVSLPDRVENPATKNTRPSRLTTNFTWSSRFSLRRVGQWFRIMFLGLYFSVLSAFQLGYRDFNVGSWILRLQAKEHTLKPTGWVRVVSGIQSLTSVYLLALWILIYFGNPFE